MMRWCYPGIGKRRTRERPLAEELTVVKVAVHPDLVVAQAVVSLADVG
jgi:hypothetical protein